MRTGSSSHGNKKAWLIVGLAVIAIVGVIAVPNLKLARMTANEAGAKKSLRMIYAAQVNFAALHPDEGYVCNLARLGVASHSKGYVLDLSDCEFSTPNNTYRASAQPVAKNKTGYWAFCSDQSGVVKGSSDSVDDCWAHGVSQSLP